MPDWQPMDVVETTVESVAPWVGANSLLETAAAERVKAWWERAQRVYPPNTQKAWRCDWASFISFCGPRGWCPLPATSDTVAAFVVYCRDAGKKPATVRRYLSTIAVAHRVSKLLNPCADEAVQLEIKALYNALSARQRQVKVLGWADIQRFLETAGHSLPATRERALLCVAYNTMARRSELVAFEVEDFRLLTDGTGRVLIRQSKIDQVGEGNTAYLPRTTVRYLNLWLNAAAIEEGPVFRRVIGRGIVTTDADGKGRIGERLMSMRSRRRSNASLNGSKCPGRDASEWALDSGRGDTESIGARYRPGRGDASGAMEDQSHTNAIW
jgi:integrase